VDTGEVEVDEAGFEFAGAPDVEEVLRRIDELPAPPAVAARVLSLALEDGADFADLARLIESDQSLALKVLRQANSLAYGLRGKVATLEQSLTVLGLATLRQVVLGIVIREHLLQDPKSGDPLLKDLWRHALTAAVAGRLLAEAARPALAGEAFAAGMVHDCGQLALLAALGPEYEDLLLRRSAGEGALLDLEIARLGLDHVLAGKRLAARFGLPQALADAAWLHHQPADVLLGLNGNRDLMLITALADRLAHEVAGDPGSEESAAGRDMLSKALGLDDARLDEIRAGIGKGFAERAALFDLEADAAHFYFRALQQANRALVRSNAELTLRREELERIRAAQGAVLAAGPELGLARSREEIFAAVARALGEGLGCPGGLAYVVDAEHFVLHGLAWGRGRQVLRCRLDDDLRPMAGDLEALPRDLRPFLAGYLGRAPGLAESDSVAPQFIKPYWAAPMLADGGFAGEVLALPPDKAGAFGPAEIAALAQLAALAAAAAGRLEHQARAEERAESLAATLRKLKRMNQKLLSAERLAAVGQLAAGAAHEINNPLAIVYARCQLLELKEPDEARKKSLRQMMEQIERITSILGSLMDFARPAAPRFEPTDLGAVLEKTLALVRGSLEKAGIRVETKITPNLAPVRADGRQLEQVFLNLLLNAEHAMEGKEGGTLSLAVGPAKDPGFAQAVVRDTGSGIAKENLSRIFDPFFTTKEEGKGTGLGLSTSYGIVQGHSGEIAVDSEEGKWTEVRVVLPLDSMAAKEDAKNGKAAVAASPSAVLVVDDEEHIREILREALEASGYPADTASDGQEALRKLAKGRYRLMLLDIRMPSRSGLSLLSAIRGKVGRMPVIVLTGMAAPEELAEALALGAARCVRKPFQIESLLALVREVLAEAEVVP
jgi:signal transduction histidine kinase/HD-like signal output (HDOD) protein/CheY-like chemotaxis protein